MTDTKGFYSELSDFYHLIYPDWEESVQRQAEALDATIREVWRGSETVLDVSCGIGTQSLGLASRGYKVTASDLSPGAIERARLFFARRKSPKLQRIFPSRGVGNFLTLLCASGSLSPGCSGHRIATGNCGAQDGLLLPPSSVRRRRFPPIY